MPPPPYTEWQQHQQQQSEYRDNNAHDNENEYQDQDNNSEFYETRNDWQGHRDAPAFSNDGTLQNQQQNQQQLLLEETLQREQALLQTVQNMTAAVVSMEQREELHVRQLDVLTERVMDGEAAAAAEHNSLLEYQANCTAAGQELAVLHAKVDEWQRSCAEFADQHDADVDALQELKVTLKKTAMEREDLAGMIERHRLNEQGPALLYSKNNKNKQKKRRGFFSWLFGWNSDDDDDDDDDDWDRVHEAARSTLLKALQTERNNVEELESAVTCLQQNNSAIAGQVESRDLIIDELNDRVAVFEEDKVVLKAALRQLQKEMNDEAPKTQRLVDDLAVAQTQVERLRDEIELLIATHQDEIVALQEVISKKQSTIQETESNLTVIGTYVDKLEERLADFAVARRDIEVRERKVQELDKRVADAERERDEMKSRVQAFEAEHEELKVLLVEIAGERSKLVKEISQLSEQRDRRQQEDVHIRELVTARDEKIKSLQENDDQWKAQAQQLESELDLAKTHSEQLQAALQETEMTTADLRNEMNATLQAKRVLQELLDESETTKSELHAKVVSLERARIPEPIKKAPTLPPPALPVFAMNTTAPDLIASNRTVPPPPPRPMNAADKLSGTGSSLSSTNITSTARQAVNATANARLPINVTNRPADRPGTPPKAPGYRIVPLRKVRKFFSKTTGIHGLFLQPSRKRPTGAAKTNRPVPVESQRPDVVKHTLTGIRTMPKNPFRKKDKKP
jgi:hypothetical protein